MRWITVMLVAALLAGCGGGTSPTSTSPATPGPTDGATSPGDGATSPGDGATSPGDGATRPPVPPTAGELSSILITPAELGPEWSLWEGFATWPDGQPGIIPEDQRALLPGIPLCAHAGEEALALAPTLRWEVFTQLHRATPDPFATMVVAQQFLLADEPAAVERTFTVLRDGLTRCLTANLPGGEWEIGLREALAVPAVGADRYAERSLGVDPGGARRETRWVLVREGAVLMAIQLDDVLISPEAEPQLTAAEVDAVVTAMAEKLP